MPSPALQSLILRHVSDAVIAIDNAGFVTYLSPSAEHQYGVPASQAVGRPLADLYTFKWLTPEDADGAEQSLASTGYWRGENLHILPNGRVLHVHSSVSRLVDDSGASVGLLAVIRDVTAAKRVEATLRESEARYRTLFQSIDEAFCIIELIFNDHGEPVDYRYVEINDQFERQTGMHNSLGRTVREILPDVEPVWPQTYGRVAITGEPTRFTDYVQALGRWFDVFAFRIGDANRRHVAVLFKDVTEQKAAADALEASEAALREADRRKNEFLAILAHELRNPLAPIRTAVGILRAPNAPEPLLARSRDIIERQVAHMARLVDDLLDISRLSRGKMSLQRGPLLLDQVLDNAVETARPLIEERRHQLEQHRPAVAVCLDGDLARLSQVFANLLNNAAKYTPPGGTITLDTSQDDESITVRVTDTGEGIAPDQFDRIFDLFAQGSRADTTAIGGLGIGLALARRLVELHGGRLTASSPGLDRGATFTVTLPIVSSVDDAAGDTRPDYQTVVGAGRRVLVVDDSTDAAAANAMLLESAGFDVRVAHSGPEAIDHAEEFHPELVLLDLGMPGMSGLETCRRLRALPQGSSIFIAAVTGWGQEESRRQTQRAGFDAHLVKPVAPDALLALTERMPSRRD